MNSVLNEIIYSEYTNNLKCTDAESKLNMNFYNKYEKLKTHFERKPKLLQLYTDTINAFDELLMYDTKRHFMDGFRLGFLLTLELLKH